MRLSACLLLGIALAAPARADTFGDIDITIESAPKGESWHGYFEYAFRVTNRSRDRSHTVTLSLPNEKRFLRDDYIREVRRTVQVGANETVRVALLQPDYPPIGGSDLTITLDGRRQEFGVQLPLNETYRRYSYGSRGPSYPAGGSAPLVLRSNRVTKPLPLPSKSAPSGGMGGMAAGMSGRPKVMRPPPGPVKPEPGLSPNTQLVPVESIDNWSSNWLAYSRYDGIVVTGEDLKEMAPPARTALWQYVETGGSLLVLGTASLPVSWRQRKDHPADLTIYEAGFGECLVSPDANLDKWPSLRLALLANSWEKTASPWRERRNTYDANQSFPVVDDIGIPIKGLFVLMLLFTLAIGPVNFVILARKKRRIWLLWTTPVISLFTCLAVFGYMLLSEGWQGHLRTETLTLLDETSHRATTVGWTAVYSPLTPSDGLHFSYDTEVMTQRMNEGRKAGAHSCTLDWSRDQHLAAGWVEARIPAHFKVRKSEARRERVAIHREADQKLSMVNGLGAEIRRFWYVDEKEQPYFAAQVAPGARAILTPMNGQGFKEDLTQPMRSVLGGTWLTTMQTISTNPLRRLRPRSYLAELDDSPFLEDALPNARTRKCRALVVGYLKDSGEAD